MNLAEYIPVTHDDNYWTADMPLFVVTIPYYHNQGAASEIVPLKHRTGTCIYSNMHPYILEPELLMTVGLYPKPKQYADQNEEIGKVLATHVKGMRQHQVGNSQAWYYPQDKLLVLWECFFASQVRKSQALTEDMYMSKLWQAFEGWLHRQFPEATRIATPGNDPIAQSIEEYQSFLRSLGYTPIAKAAFGKDLK